MWQQALQETPDRFYEVLPMVQEQGEETLETGRQQATLSSLSLGNRTRVLEFLRLVQGAGSTRMMVYRL